MKRAALLAVLATLAFVAMASGERIQRGNLILSLDGGFSPLTLPREHKAPVSVHIAVGLQTADRSILPKVTRVELGIPGQGAISTRGLPLCTVRRLRNTSTAKALELCRRALVGRGRMIAQVKIPQQAPFKVPVPLLAFNGRVDGRRAVIVHGLSVRPPTVAVLPFLIEPRQGNFATALVAHLPRNLGPWPRFAQFEIDLSRRYVYQGHRLSYIGASCPLPKILNAGTFSFAKATFTLAGGRQISTSIPRSCRAR
jgi:hypothetical protein